MLKSIITVHSLFSTFAESHPMFVFSNSWRKFFYQSSVRKSFTFPQVFAQNFRPMFKLKIFNKLYEVNFCEVRCDAFMMSSSR